MEHIYTASELISLYKSSPEYLRSLRRRYTKQHDLLIRLRVQFINKSIFYDVNNRNELRFVLQEAKDRDDLMLPQKDDVRWHTFTTEQYHEAKAYVGRMRNNEKELEAMVEGLGKWLVGCGWGLEVEMDVRGVEL